MFTPTRIRDTVPDSATVTACEIPTGSASGMFSIGFAFTTAVCTGAVAPAPNAMVSSGAPMSDITRPESGRPIPENGATIRTKARSRSTKKIGSVSLIGVGLQIAMSICLQEGALIVFLRRTLLEFVGPEDIAVVNGQAARRQAAIEVHLGTVFDDEVLVRLARPILHHGIVVAMPGLESAGVLRSISLSHQPARSRR